MTGWLVLLLLGMAADHYTSYRAAQSGLTEEGNRIVVWLFGKRPSQGQLLTLSAAQVAVLLGIWALIAPTDPPWWVAAFLFGFPALRHLFAAWRNRRRIQ